MNDYLKDYYENLFNLPLGIKQEQEAQTKLLEEERLANEIRLQQAKQNAEKRKITHWKNL